MITNQNTCETEMEIMQFHSPTQIVPNILKDMFSMWKKNNHIKEVCRSGRNRRLHSIDPQKEQHQDKDKIDKVNINSIYIDSITLNSKHSVQKKQI